MKKVITVTTNDLTGKPITGKVQELVITVNGESIELDLDSESLGRFYSVADEFIKAGKPAKARESRVSGGDAYKIRNRKIRRWAVSKGYGINARGRIPAWIIEEYDEAHLEESKNTLRTA